MRKVIRRQEDRDLHALADQTVEHTHQTTAKIKAECTSISTILHKLLVENGYHEVKP